MPACPPCRAQQDPDAPPEPAPVTSDPAPPPYSGPLVTVRGIVRNAVTHEPLPRVLVQAGGESGPGALTDGDGRFEIPSLVPGAQIVQLRRPGYRDTPSGLPSASPDLEDSTINITHNIYVASGMADLDLAMTPTNVIRGRVELSTGDPGEGISLLLLRRTVQDGRAVWRLAGNAHTNSDGMFRFAGLDDGAFAIYSEPSMENDLPVTLVEPHGNRQITRNGYPMQFYPDVRDFSGAGRIQVSNGTDAQANLRLTLEPFHLVRAEVSALPRVPSGINAAITDSSGHQLPYSAQYDAQSHSVQAMLPTGTYTLRVSGFETMRAGALNARQTPLAGQAEFTVTDRPVHLRLTLAPQVNNAIQTTITRTRDTTAAPANQPGGINVMVSQAGGALSDGMVSQFAAGMAPGTLQGTVLTPGQYWIHTIIGQPGLCEAGFTAGGANLAHEPLAIGTGGISAPLSLNLRDDCASLQLSLPASVYLSPGREESALTVYVVPDRETTVDITPVTVRPSTGGSVTIHNLTPGSYHVYALTQAADLEYRNRELLSRLPSQSITLEPASTGTLVLEAPAP